MTQPKVTTTIQQRYQRKGESIPRIIVEVDTGKNVVKFGAGKYSHQLLGEVEFEDINQFIGMLEEAKRTLPGGGQ